MRALSAEVATQPPLPDPQTILRRARLRERLAAEQATADRVTRPILLAGVAGPFAVAVALSTLPDSSSLIVLAAAGLGTALAAGLGVRLALSEE